MNYLLVSVYARPILDYRLWYNFGKLINDYSGYGHYGVNGTNETIDSHGPIATPLGAYFKTGDTITLPPTYYPSTNDSSNSGMFFKIFGVYNIEFYLTINNKIRVNISGIKDHFWLHNNF